MGERTRKEGPLLAAFQILVFITGLCFTFLSFADKQKLIFVDSSSGEAFEWVESTKWNRVAFSSLLKPSNDSSENIQEFPWGKVRVTSEQKVEIWVGNEWKNSVLRPPPGGIRYKRALLEPNGGVLVELGGNASGFNYILPDGKVIVARLAKWEGDEPPLLRQVIPFGNKGGFIGIGPEEKLWHISSPDKNRRAFKATSLMTLDKDAQLLFINGNPVVKTKSGEYRVINNLSETESINPPDARKEGFFIVDDTEGRTRLSQIAESIKVRAPPEVEKPVEEPAKPDHLDPNFLPRYEITYEQFQDLVKQKVGELRELKGFWAHNRDFKGKETYRVLFGGGRLRGLLKWIDDQLTSGTGLDKVKMMEPPGLDHLALQSDTDKDLIVLGSGKTEVSFSGWDVLSEDFYRASVACGGSGLEKVFVSRDEISDPYGALRQFAEGQLDFVFVSPKKYRKSQSSDAIWGNSRVAQALRHLRFLREFPNHETTETSRKIIQGFSHSDDPFVLPKGGKDNWWVYKGMRRLFGAVDRNVGEFLQILKEWDLLELLAKNEFYTTSKSSIVGLEDLEKSDLKARGWTLKDLPLLESFLAHNYDDGRVALKAQFLVGVKSFEEMVHVLEYRRGSPPSGSFIQKVSRVLRYRLPEINISSWSREYYLRAQGFAKSVEAHRKLKEKAFDFIKNMADFSAVLEYCVRKNAQPSAEYVEENQKWLMEHLELLEALHPSVDDICDIEKRFTTGIGQSIALKELGIRAARSPEDLEKALAVQVSEPTKKFLFALEKFISERISVIVAKTDFETLKRIRNQFGYHLGFVKDISRHLSSKAGTRGEYLSILYVASGWSEQQKKEIVEDFLDSTFEDAKKLGVSWNDLRTYAIKTKNHSAMIWAQKALLNEAANANAEEFLKLVSQVEMLNWSDSKIIEELDKIVDDLVKSEKWKSGVEKVQKRLAPSEMEKLVIKNLERISGLRLDAGTINHLYGFMLNTINRIRFVRGLKESERPSNAGSMVRGCAWVLGKLRGS